VSAHDRHRVRLRSASDSIKLQLAQLLACRASWRGGARPIEEKSLGRSAGPCESGAASDAATVRGQVQGKFGGVPDDRVVPSFQALDSSALHRPFKLIAETQTEQPARSIQSRRVMGRSA